MGVTKIKNGDNHIVFHVGKELPEAGDNFLIGIGRQNAQGRGVYCSEEPDLKYTGGEHYRVKLPISPIFCVPMTGKWRKGRLKKKDNKVVMHTNGRLIAMKNLKYKDFTDSSGRVLRFYFSTDVSFFAEPKTRIFDEFSGALRSGKMSSDEGLRRLEEEFHVTADLIDSGLVMQKLVEAMNEGRIPEIVELRELIDFSDSLRTDISETIQRPEFRELRDSAYGFGEQLR